MDLLSMRWRQIPQQSFRGLEESRRDTMGLGQAYFGSKINADIRIWFYYIVQYMTLKAAVLCDKIQIEVNVLPGIVI